MIWTTLYLLILLYLLDTINIGTIALSILITYIGTLPDVDFKIFRKEKWDKEKKDFEFIEVDNPHRWFFTHSLILPGIVFYYYPTLFTLLVLLAIGHHLALDIVGNLIFGKKATGYYTICLIPSLEFNFWIFKVKTRSIRLSGKQTTFYLLTNWIITLIILVMVIL